MAKLENVNRLKRVPYDEKLAGMCPPEWDPNWEQKPPCTEKYDNDLWWGA